MAVVLTTGCSSGFGLEAALAFARRGDTVCATMRNLAKADALRKRAADEGVEIDLEALDVTDDASVAAGIAAVVERHGPIDVLVNNAGVGYGGPVETIPLEHAQALMDTNFWGAVRTSRLVLPSMRERRTGVIINITSLSGLIPGALYTGMYAASKHALGALSEALATEVGPFGIRVVCVAPGFFSTEITNNNQATDDGIAGSAYEADASWWDAFMNASVTGGADASIVADAIVDAANDPATPLQRPVGDDAALYLDLWDQTRTYEGWIAAAIPVVEMTAGPRPIPT
jgi:NAD(P)-dependent dehydrogenase (short-subunit alcohol dehydrogenase family)